MQLSMASGASPFRVAPWRPRLAAATEVVSRWARRTPLLESPALNEMLGGRRVLVKAESLQVSGSFKYRGAVNRVYNLDPEEKGRGVVAFSSGNFAQGLACAAQQLQVPCTIVMPADAPTMKMDKTRGYGAEVVISHHDPTENREVVANALAKDFSVRTGAVLLHPFDDDLVIAGQASVGVEMAAQAAELGAELGTVAVCTGGGGLSSGIALALADLAPDCRVCTVEPEHYDDTARSLQTGVRQGLQEGAGATICDALQAAMPGERNFAILSGLGVRGAVVSDSEVAAAMAVGWDTLKLVLEPSGAVALAAALANDGRLGEGTDDGRALGVVASGANVAISDYFKIVDS